MNDNKIIEIDEKYNEYYKQTKKPVDKNTFVLWHVLNDKNQYVNKKFINNIFKTYGLNHKVKNLDKYQEAFIHDAYLIDNLSNYKYLRQIKDTPMIENINEINNIFPLQTNSYQRLEYLGDAVIHMAIAKYLYERYPNEDEGFLTKIRTRLENGKTEAEISRCLGLHEYVVISRTMEVTGGRLNNYKTLEDAFEAFIGALSTEISLDTCVNFVINIIEKECDITDMICYENNYKGRLMKICHAEKWDEVNYDTDDDGDGDENKIKKYFSVVATCGGKYIGRGKGKSKKSAQQRAAKEILIKLVYSDY